MRKIIGWVGVALIGSAFVVGFIAYFVFRFDPQTKLMFDGFGRPLSESPLLMRLLFGQERLWAGWFWFLGDMVLFWGAIAAGFGLASWGFKDPKDGA